MVTNLKTKSGIREGNYVFVADANI